MLLEVLERVILLETFPFVKWQYTELAHVDSHTPVNSLISAEVTSAHFSAL
jgi:hypothetical protein